jgi:hypothetical protein
MRERVDRLAAELSAARDEFSAALERVDAELLTTPGLAGDWSAREVVAHLAHWDRWATRCVEHPTTDGLASLVTGGWDVDAQNAEVAARAAGLSMEAVRDEEADAYAAFAAALAALGDDAGLDVAAPWGGTLEIVIRENGPDHYREHSDHLRAWFAADEEDEEDEEDQ